MFVVVLEQILQSKLHDSRIQRVANPAELGRTQIRADCTCPETVQYVECFSSKLHSLSFADAERTRESHVKLPGQRQLENDSARVSKSADCRLPECSGIQVLRTRPCRPIDVYRIW